MKSSNSELKVAILGRGIAGLCGAYFLLKEGIRADVYGRIDGSHQASRAAQGVLCNKGLIFAESPLFRAKLESLKTMPRFLREIEELSGMKIPRTFNGVSEPLWTEEDFQASVTRIYRHRFWGIHRTEFQVGSQLPLRTARSPLGYLHYPADGWFDPRALLDALEHLLRREGLRFYGKEIETLEDESQGVRIDGGFYDRVVLANGAGLEAMWSQLDCKPLRIFLIGGQTIECPFDSTQGTRIEVKGNQSLAIHEGRAIFGSTSWLGRVSEDQKADEIALREAMEQNFSYGFGPGRARSGTRLRFKDRMPLVGWLNSGKYAKKVYILGGFYKNGMHIAEICAQDMAIDVSLNGMIRRYPEFSCQRFSV